jgi:hypothetical protein
MRREIVEGSNLIYSVGYSKEKQIVEIRLKDKEKKPGKIYRYLNFPPEKYKAFRAADSMGRFFLFGIKDKHECVKVEEDAHKDKAPVEAITPTDTQEEGSDDEETSATS